MSGDDVKSAFLCMSGTGLEEKEMSEEGDQSVDEVSKLLLEYAFSLQRTVLQDWQGLTMSMAQLKVLITLSFKGPTAISRLAEALGISHPTASQLVDRLLQAGLVERVESVTDRRFTLAHLTESGEQLAQRLWQGRMAHIRGLAQLDKQDLAALRQGLLALTSITASLPIELSEGDD
jgi:DNA-binding MarR family transcriptional regulator